MTFAHQIGAIVRLDFFDFWRTRWVVAGFFSLNLADLMIMLLVLDRLIPFDYIRFALPGIVASAASLAALDQSRKVFWELQTRTHYYLRTLPFKPTALALARLTGAAAKALAYSLWLLVTAAILGYLDVERIVIAIAAIWGLGLGMGAVGIATGAVIREFGAWSAINALLVLALMTLSSAFYPLNAIRRVSPALGVVAMINPVSGAADLLRWSLGLIEVMDPGTVAVYLSLAVLLLTVSGGFLYHRILTKDK